MTSWAPLSKGNNRRKRREGLAHPTPARLNPGLAYQEAALASVDRRLLIVVDIDADNGTVVTDQYRQPTTPPPIRQRLDVVVERKLGAVTRTGPEIAFAHGQLTGQLQVSEDKGNSAGALWFHHQRKDVRFPGLEVGNCRFEVVFQGARLL